MDVKQCRKCGVVKPTEAFGPHRRAKDGLQSYCRVCQREYATDRLKTMSEDHKEPAVLALAKLQGNGPVIIINDDTGLSVKPMACAKSLCMSCSKGKDCVPSRAVVLGGVVISCEDHIQ